MRLSQSSPSPTDIGRVNSRFMDDLGSGVEDALEEMHKASGTVTVLSE